jgi:xanthine dehydrogenase molybdenum-binding subunit
VVGKRVPLKDAVEKATGRAEFTGDFKLPGMLHAKFLRSPYPHARVLKVDTSEAERLPGVKAVLSKKNAPRVKVPAVFNESKIFDLPQDKVLFDDKVRYPGEEVAVVAAVTERIAEEALKLIKVDYEELPAILGVKEAMGSDVPLIHEDRKSNIASPLIIPFGNVEEGFKEADYVFEEEFKTQSQRHAAMETHCCVASFDKAGNLTTWVSHQTPHALQELLSEYLEIPQSKIRVIKLYLGGGFGGKLDMVIEHTCALLSRMSGRPVKIVLNRREDFSCTITRHADVIRLKMGVNKDGEMTAMQVHLLSDVGGYFFHKSVLGVTARTFLGYYKCPNVKFEGYAVYTNHSIAGPMRGYGHPQALFALESMLDMVADRLGMDPIEVRIKNFVTPCGLPECLSNGAKKIGWEGGHKPTATNGQKRRGIGLGCFTNAAGTGGKIKDYSAAIVKLFSDGTAQLITGATDLGTGCNTSLAQIVAEELGLDLDDVAVTAGDTSGTLFDSGAFASRTLYMCGLTARTAAADVKKQVLTWAADKMGVEAENLEIREKRVYNVLDPKESADFYETVREAAEDLTGEAALFIGKAFLLNPGHGHSHGVEFAEVEVDMETGRVDVIKVVAEQDVGKAINPMIVEGQIEGAIQQMTGYALTEDAIFEKDTGEMINADLIGYGFLGPTDMPDIEVGLVEIADMTGPYGARGVAEGATGGMAPAVANAIFNATGVRLTDLPITAEKVQSALSAKRRNDT